jgi:hypothetical protein
LGSGDVKGERVVQAQRVDVWKWLVGGALVLLLFEWYIFNRRVYL